MAGFLPNLALVFLASAGPIVVPIDETRFRVHIVFDDTSPSAHAEAQFALMRAAKKHCKGRGEAVSEGTLRVDRAEPLRRNKDAIDLSEVYVCRPKA